MSFDPSKEMEGNSFPVKETINEDSFCAEIPDDTAIASDSNNSLKQNTPEMEAFDRILNLLRYK